MRSVCSGLWCFTGRGSRARRRWHAGSWGRTFLSLDDPTLLTISLDDPTGFVADRKRPW